MSQSSGGGIGRQVAVLLAGIAVLGLALWAVLGGDKDDPAEAAPTPTQVVEPTPEPVNPGLVPPSDETAPVETTEPLDDGGGPDGPDPAIPTVEEPLTTTEPTPTLAPVPADAGYVTPPEDPSDPAAIAARYVVAYRTVNYRVQPSSWLDDADYLEPAYRDMLTSSYGAADDISELEAIKFQSVPEEVGVQRIDQGDGTEARVAVRWQSRISRSDAQTSVSEEQGTVVILRLVDDAWKVVGETTL